MTPYDLLTDNDQNIIDNYIYRSTDSFRREPLDLILLDWNRSKEGLLSKVFHDTLRFTTHVHINRSDGTREERRDAVIKASTGLVSAVVECVYAHLYNERLDKRTLDGILKLFSPDLVLADEQVRELPVVFDDEYHMFRGKRMRVIRKVLELVEFDDMEAFNIFRDRVSLIRTTQDMDADITFSIHPVDYLSMSDNSCGWSSCMSVASKKGACREGVLEYLNSKTAIVAYISSKNDYLPGVPNKAWRMMVFCDPDAECVMASRQYPFESEELAREAVIALQERSNWYRDTVLEYPSTPVERAVVGSCDNMDVRMGSDAFKSAADPHGSMLKSVVPVSLGACNDFFVFNGESKFYSTGHKLVDEQVHIMNMSGRPTCLLCGDDMPTDTYGTSKLVCKACEKEVQSDKCDFLSHSSFLGS